MSPIHSHACSSSPPRDDHGRYILDAKGAPQVTLIGTGARDPYASYRHSPDLDSESDSEETTAPPDAHPPVSIGIVSPVVIWFTDHVQVQGDEPVLDQTRPRVRFRSRVRISAGIGRRGRASNASSISGSPSSSISAPLRTHYTGSNGWGTLGSRLKLAMSQPADDVDAGKANVSWNEDERARKRRVRSPWTYVDDDADELTHLLTATSRYSYVGRHAYHGYYDDGERERERWWRERLVDEAFGKWPGRLLNRHWWWWHLEHILCCCCEPDDEEFM